MTTAGIEKVAITYCIDRDVCGLNSHHAKFERTVFEDIGSDVQSVSLMPDNCYYVTLYINPERDPDMVMLERAIKTAKEGPEDA